MSYLSDFTYGALRVHPCHCQWLDFLFLYSGWILFDCVCVSHFLKNRSSIDGYLDCYHILTVVNNAAGNTLGAYISFQASVFIFFGKVPRSGIAESYGGPVFNS